MMVRAQGSLEAQRGLPSQRRRSASSLADEAEAHWARAGEGLSTPGYHPESPVHQKLSQAGSEEDEASPLSG